MSAPRDRDGRPRDDRRRRRDRDRGDRSDRDYDRRDRDRDKEFQTENPIQRPVVLLRRPGSNSASSNSQSQQSHSQTSVKDKDASSAVVIEEVGTGGSVASNDLQKPSRTKILQRSNIQRNAGSTHDIHAASSQQDVTSEKPKPSGPSSLLDLLRPPYKFPHDNAVTLIDKNMKIKPLADFDFFANGLVSPDFFVITAVGKPLTGKSTILSHLVHDEGFGTKKIFTERNRDQEMESSMYITSDHIIFIEMASLFNCAAAHDLITCAPQQGTLETTTLTWNLRLMRWALSVSHVVLLVSESPVDPNLYQLINSAEMIRSMDSALGEEVYPELVYVCNKSSRSYLDNEDAQSKFQRMFSSVTGRPSRINPNFFVLPHTKLGYAAERYEELKTKLYDFNLYNRASFAPEKPSIPKFAPKYSATEWYCNATKLWEEMSHNNFFSAYVKLLP